MAKGFAGLMKIAEDEAKVQWNVDFNTEHTSGWYKSIAPLILVGSYLEDKFISLKAGRNIYTAFGTQLDDMFSNDLVFRIQGAKSKGNATVTGTDGTDITLGSIDVLGSNNLIYTNISEGTILNGTLSLVFECTSLTSNGDLPPNNFKSVQKAPYGVLDVQNQQMTGGLNTETDYEYMQRYLTTIRDIAWTLPSILSAIKKLNGVSSCDGIRNNTNTDGVNGIPKKSIRIVVEGGDEQEIANTMYLKIHTANTVGSIERQVQMTPSNFETIRFDRPTTSVIDYQYTIISPDKAEILTLLTEYLNKTKVGDIISDQEFRKSKLKGYLSVNLTVMTISFKRGTETAYVPFVQLNYDEKGSAGTGVEKP